VVSCLEILSKVIELSLRTKKCDADKAELAVDFFGFATGLQRRKVISPHMRV
jgi:hypothetical protein